MCWTLGLCGRVMVVVVLPFVRWLLSYPLAVFPCRWLRTRTELAGGKRSGGSSQPPSNPWPISWPRNYRPSQTPRYRFGSMGCTLMTYRAGPRPFQKLVAGGVDVSEAVAVSGLAVPSQNVSDT